MRGAKFQHISNWKTTIIDVEKDAQNQLKVAFG
jgi:hypothetical protein